MGSLTVHYHSLVELISLTKVLDQTKVNTQLADVKQRNIIE